MCVQDEAMTDLKVLEERQDLQHLLDTINKALNAVADEVQAEEDVHLWAPDLSEEE